MPYVYRIENIITKEFHYGARSIETISCKGVAGSKKD
jgi:hypothetical protein